MFRKALIPILQAGPMSLSEIARQANAAPKDVIDALEHLSKSVKHTDSRLVVQPAECRKCGFSFRTEKFTTPSKCPECRGSWIAEPLFSIEGKEPG
jgi:transcriptional regulator